MKRRTPKFQRYVFVCENLRDTGRPCCGKSGTVVREFLKQAVKERGYSDSIRVSRAGCLDTCEDGPNVLVMPDRIWYQEVSPEDVDSILDEVIGSRKV